MAEGTQEWTTALQLEQCRAARINSMMQAIIAVPIFDGAPGDLEFFLKRMDLIVQQLQLSPLDGASNNYILGYFYSRVSWEVLQDIGASCDTEWEDVKAKLRERYGGAARSTPRLILREVLLSRNSGESASNYAKSILKGFRKVQNRIKDSTENAQEASIRTKMLEELASEMLMQNLPRRVKQWVRIVKPATLEALVKTVEDEEAEEREERWEEPRKKVSVARETNNERRTTQQDNWQKVQHRRREYRPVRNPQQQVSRDRDLGRERAYRGSGNEDRRIKSFRNRKSECWECKEVGHFARECPYIFRREKQRFLDRRDEPMEVNITRTGRSRSDEDSDSDASTSSSHQSIRSRDSNQRKCVGSRRVEDKSWPPLPAREGEKSRWNKTKSD